MGIVTLVSGGFDSTLMSLMAHEEGATLFPLFIDYGQLGAKKEWAACQRLHEQFGLPSVTYMDLSGFGNTIPSGLTDSNLRINEDSFLRAAISFLCWQERLIPLRLGLIVSRLVYSTLPTVFFRIRPKNSCKSVNE